MPESFESETSSDIETPAKLAHRRPKRPAIWASLTALGLLLALGSVIGLGLSERGVPARCPEGRVPIEHRCCWATQRLEAGVCVGTVTACPPPYRREESGCSPQSGTVSVTGGELTVAPVDWQAQGLLEERTLRVASFRLDRTEVPSTTAAEPWLPRTMVDAPAAERHCRSLGGRLPTEDEWIFAAAGAEGRRFPWGQTGLVCRRAVYGLVDGPCASSARPGPDAVGSRPDGATPDGLLDMVGNVKEWVRVEQGHVAMGGSFRSTLASELKVWSRDARSGPRDDVGFRCAYAP